MTRFNSKNRKLKSDAMRIANSKIIQRNQETMILEVCSSGAFDVPNVQATDVLTYPRRKVIVTDHPGSKTIQKLLEKEGCVSGNKRRNSILLQLSQPGIKCLSHHETHKQILSTDTACNPCRALSQVSVSEIKAFKDYNSTDIANSKVYGPMQTGKFKFRHHT